MEIYYTNGTHAYGIFFSDDKIEQRKGPSISLHSIIQTIFAIPYVSWFVINT